METISGLITKAQKLGLKIYLQNGQIMINAKWPIDEIPDAARCILGEFKKRKGELLSHVARHECQEAGHCRQFEFDCDRYPVWGTWLCVDRIKNTP